MCDWDKADLECKRLLRDDPRAAVLLQSISLSCQVLAEVLEEQIVPYCVEIQLDISKKPRLLFIGVVEAHFWS